MTIEQTIEIPASRNVHFDVALPETVPVGTSHLRLVFMPTPAEAAKWEAPVAPPPAKKQHNNPPLDHHDAFIALAWGSRPHDSSRTYAGCLKGKGIFKGDPVEIQRKMRDEWENPHS
jgi:hypothetical protein